MKRKDNLVLYVGGALHFILVVANLFIGNWLGAGGTFVVGLLIIHFAERIHEEWHKGFDFGWGEGWSVGVLELSDNYDKIWAQGYEVAVKDMKEMEDVKNA